MGNETIECDTLVYATGYEHSFPFLANHSFASRNQTRTVPSRGDVREMLVSARVSQMSDRVTVKLTHREQPEDWVLI